MIDFRDYNTTLFDERRYVADANKATYALMYRPTDYSYDILKLESSENGKVKAEKVENPTQEQLEYALLNWIVYDNDSNRNKTGVYAKDLDQIVEDYAKVLHMAKTNTHVNTSYIFKRYGLDGGGEYWQGALNGVIRDILKGIQKEKFKKENNPYEFSLDGVFGKVLYERDANGDRVILEPTMEYGYELYKVILSGNDMEMKKIQNPTKDQLETALLNVIIRDNYTNPNKTGIYFLDIEQIEDAFNMTMARAKKDGLTTEQMLRVFGLDYNGELMSSAVNGLIKDVLDSEKESDGGYPQYTDGSSIY